MEHVTVETEAYFSWMKNKKTQKTTKCVQRKSLYSTLQVHFSFKWLRKCHKLKMKIKYHDRYIKLWTAQYRDIRIIKYLCDSKMNGTREIEIKLWIIFQFQLRIHGHHDLNQLKWCCSLSRLLWLHLICMQW